MVYKNFQLPDGTRLDIETQNGKIIKIGKVESSNAKDMKGAYILPKLVDLNVRLKDGTLSAKTVQECVQDAQVGGVGHIVLQPDSNPPIDDEVVLEYAQNAIKETKEVGIDLLIDALQEDLSLSNIAILLKKGALSARMSTIAKNDIAMKVAQYMQMYKRTLFCKAEDNSLISAGVMFEGDVSSKLGLAGIPELSEVVHVSRMIEIARYYDIAIHFQSIASPRSLEMIEKAKNEGVKLSAEVSLHHLVFSDLACENFNTTAKIDPPLVDESMRKELIKALQNGRVETLTLLHQPSSPVNKEVAFYDAAYGSSALSDAWALYYTKLVKSGIVSLEDVVKTAVENPSRLAGIEVPKLEIGESIEKFVALDVDSSYKVSNSNSLYNGEEIFGKTTSLS